MGPVIALLVAGLLALGFGAVVMAALGGGDVQERRRR